MAMNLTMDNFEQEVLNAQVPVLVDFWAVWCMPCKMLAPVIEELSEEANGAYKVGKVDVDAAPGLAALLMGLVTRLLFLTLRSHGLADIPNLGVCLVFGGVFYLAALQAQGVSLRFIFFRK